MKEFHITWEIELYANSPEEAARAALAIQRRSDSTATTFDVVDDEGNKHRFDLLAQDELPELTQDNMGREFRCRACGREESECSAEPCDAVIADRNS